MADKLSEEQIQEFKLVFAAFDRNRDGYVETEDVGYIIKMLGLQFSDEQVNDMMAEVDADGSGNIDFIEFLNMMARKMTGMKPYEQIKEAFDLLDHGGNGFVSLNKVFQCLRSLGEDVTEEELQLLFHAVKPDGDDKKVDLDSFIRLCDPSNFPGHSQS